MLQGNNNEEKIFNYIVAIIGNEYGACGLMGNLYAESALRSINLQSTGNKRLDMTDEEYTEAVDNGTYTNFVKDSHGYGLAQWTYWSRKQALLKYVQSKKASVGDLETQLEFLFKELKKSYKKVWNVLCTAKTVKEASDIVLTGYEKPKNQSDANKEKRAAIGQKYFDKYAKPKSCVYVVKSGDTLGKIAKKYGTKVDKIVADNKATYSKITANFIRTGWKLVINL